MCALSHTHTHTHTETPTEGKRIACLDALSKASDGCVPPGTGCVVPINSVVIPWAHKHTASPTLLQEAKDRPRGAGLALREGEGRCAADRSCCILPVPYASHEALDLAGGIMLRLHTRTRTHNLYDSRVAKRRELLTEYTCRYIHEHAHITPTATTHRCLETDSRNICQLHFSRSQRLLSRRNQANRLLNTNLTSFLNSPTSSHTHTYTHTHVQQAPRSVRSRP